MLRCWRRFSFISARPLRAAEPRRFMFSDDGGVGTISSRVRRARSSCGGFGRPGRLAAAFFFVGLFKADLALTALGRAAALFARRPVDFGRAEEARRALRLAADA